MTTRPRPYAARLRGTATPVAAPRVVGGDAAGSYRPLLSATAASGVMTIGVLQFMGDIWSDLPTLSREYLTMAVQGAFIGFLFQLGAVIIALLAGSRSGSRFTAALNGYGVAAVTAGVFITGTLVSRALLVAQPSTLEPVDSLALFSAIGVLGLIALATVALVSRIAAFVRSFHLGARS